MSEHKSPLDRALDLFVFAPLGFALEARRVLPELVEKGRQQATGQVTVAKMIGQMAVQQGQKEAGKVIGNVQRQATSTLQNRGVVPKPQPASGNGAPSAPARRPDPTPASRSTPASAPSPARETPSARTATATPPTPRPAPTPASPPETATTPMPATPSPAPASPPPTATPAPTGSSSTADLAIPDYDSLSASQVVPRLAGLSTPELEAVRSYEASHRARKTILNRVAQLQAE